MRMLRGNDEEGGEVSKVKRFGVYKASRGEKIRLTSNEKTSFTISSRKNFGKTFRNVLRRSVLKPFAHSSRILLPY